jgi:hypothetical protein
MEATTTVMNRTGARTDIEILQIVVVSAAAAAAAAAVGGNGFVVEFLTPLLMLMLMLITTMTMTMTMTKIFLMKES